MSEKIIKAFEDHRNNPFQFKHLVLCHSLAELQHVPSPKVSATLCQPVPPQLFKEQPPSPLFNRLSDEMTGITTSASCLVTERTSHVNKHAEYVRKEQQLQHLQSRCFQLSTYQRKLRSLLALVSWPLANDQSLLASVDVSAADKPSTCV